MSAKQHFFQQESATPFRSASSRFVIPNVLIFPASAERSVDQNTRSRLEISTVTSASQSGMWEDLTFAVLELAAVGATALAFLRP